MEGGVGKWEERVDKKQASKQASRGVVGKKKVLSYTWLFIPRHFLPRLFFLWRAIRPGFIPLALATIFLLHLGLPSVECAKMITVGCNVHGNYYERSLHVNKVGPLGHLV